MVPRRERTENDAAFLIAESVAPDMGQQLGYMMQKFASIVGWSRQLGRKLIAIVRLAFAKGAGAKEDAHMLAAHLLVA